MPSPVELPSAQQEEPNLPTELAEALAALGISDTGEIGLRKALEDAVSAYTLYRLPPAAARKWKARYRIMLGDTYYDCQTVPEAYARALISRIAPDAAPSSGRDETSDA